jgi:hypothetical protein
MKTLKNLRLKLFGIFGLGLIAIAVALTARSQTAPLLSITALGTNQFSISFTNSPPSTWDLQWTPILGDPDYPWTFAAVGTPGQSNYLLNMGTYQSGFFRTILDTNSIPIWEEADPNNPGAGILTVFIDSPTNHSTLTQ